MAREVRLLIKLYCTRYGMEGIFVPGFYKALSERSFKLDLMEKDAVAEVRSMFKRLRDSAKDKEDT